VQQDGYLHHLSRYIHLNPVRAQLVEDPSKYEWSSCKNYFLDRKEIGWLDTKFILSMFDQNIARARREHKKFVMNAQIDSQRFIDNNTHKGFAIGDEDFFNDLKARFLEDKIDPEIPMIRAIKRTDEPILDEIRKKTEEKIANNEKLVRKTAIYLARKHTQFKLREISEYFGNITDAGVSVLCKRVERERMNNKLFNKLLEAIEHLLNIET